MRDCHCLASDFNHTCNLRRVIIHQDNIRRLDRRVTSHASHCNTDICAGENRCIVDAVADKCQLPLSGHLRLHLLDLLHLIRRKQLRVRLIDANLRSHRLADRFPIARQHNSTADSSRLQSTDRILRLRLDRIGNQDTSGKFSVLCQINHSADAVAFLIRYIFTLHQASITRQNFVTVDRCLDTMTGNLVGFTDAG